MATARWYVTSAIPYVNAAPHLGHALEFVQADTLARWRRRRGDEVRSQWGTDDNAPKNAQAAHEAGEDTQAFVDRHAEAFEQLREPLQLGFDGFIRTSRDPGHRPAVVRLWNACAQAGAQYRARYEGHYCGGCERFYDEEELGDAFTCPEHGARTDRVIEDNWFFRLSRYADGVCAAIVDGTLRIAPEHRKNEVLAFLATDVRDISVSRPTARTRGWGIPVPGDPDQTIYVWFDALINYISALGFGEHEPARTDERSATDRSGYATWWTHADRRVHVIGKGISRFHAVYWPAFLLSAGQPLPTDVLVHEYVTTDGAKISKSTGGGSTAPTDLADRFGSDALRWWLLRDVSAVGDTDFRVERLVERHDQDLANGLGNLITRTLGLVRRAGVSRAQVHDARDPAGPSTSLAAAERGIDEALERLDTRAATGRFVEVVRATNGYVSRRRPWELVGDGDVDRREELVSILGEVVHTCRWLVDELEPFLPAASTRLRATLRASLEAGADGDVARAIFPRLAKVPMG
jgi:methionyl-tRNA synthetase